MTTCIFHMNPIFTWQSLRAHQESSTMRDVRNVPPPPTKDPYFSFYPVFGHFCRTIGPPTDGCPLLWAILDLPLHIAIIDGMKQLTSWQQVYQMTGLSLTLVYSSTHMSKSVWTSGFWKPLIHKNMSKFRNNIFHKFSIPKSNFGRQEYEKYSIVLATCVELLQPHPDHTCY